MRLTAFFSLTILVSHLGAETSGAMAVSPGARVFEVPGNPVAAGPIDRLVFGRLDSLGIRRALCSDAVFLRRVFLDTTGALPSVQEARAFLEDSSADKRSRLIDELLDRPEFATYQAMRWADILRIKAEFPVNLWPNAAQAYHHWVLASIRENKPYDQFVRELLTSSGSNFRVGPVNFYRAIQNKTPEGITDAVALAMMGVRSDRWPQETREGMAVFFSQVGYKPSREWKEELIFWDPLNANAWAAKAAIESEAARPDAPPANPGPRKKSANKVRAEGEPAFDFLRTRVPAGIPGTPGTKATPLIAVFPDGKRVTLSPEKDPRESFADWLIRPENPWFARAQVNRVWYWLVGRGVVHEADDIRPDNPPANPELLAWLENDFVAGNFDVKRLYRTILNSSTYQLSPLAKSDKPAAAANFASYPVRRLEAEVLIDAINRVTGSRDLYTSAIPEPFTYIPKDMPAVAIADGSITSSFLALFGRSARATGMLGERSNNHLPAQWLHTLNSSHIQRKIENSQQLKRIVGQKRPFPKTLDHLYLLVLSRFPTAEELEIHRAYGAKRNWKTRQEWNDIMWSLVNSSEFLYRH